MKTPRSNFPTPSPNTLLEGQFVRLRPVQPEDADLLKHVGLDPSIWKWSPTRVTGGADFQAYFDAALRGRDREEFVVFAIERKTDGVLAGMTRYGNIVPAHGRLEIGWTWLAPEFRGSVVNPEAKLLLLEHAFDALGYARVELKTDALNTLSRAAIQSIGAREEGSLRKHIRTDSGRWRNTVYFSILDTEWPEVRKELEGRIQRRNAG